MNKSYSTSSKVGFIHITKTGGTHVKHENKNNKLYVRGHKIDALYYYTKKIPCFAIIRNPIERYKSMFYYYGYGSNIYVRDRNNMNDINLFAEKHYNDPKFIEKKYAAGGRLFNKQIEWLNNNNCFIVLYDKENLIKNIKTFLLDEFSIHFDDDCKEKKINVSNVKYKQELTKDTIDIIKKLYYEDFELYNKLLEYKKKNLKCYCKLKEL